MLPGQCESEVARPDPLKGAYEARNKLEKRKSAAAAAASRQSSAGSRHCEAAPKRLVQGISEARGQIQKESISFALAKLMHTSLPLSWF